MEIEFDFGQIDDGRTNFYITRERGKEPTFESVSIDNGLRRALNEAVVATWTDMRALRDEPELYDPSNVYGPSDFLYFPLDDPLAAKAQHIHSIVNPIAVTKPMDVLPQTRLYVAKVTDHLGRQLTAAKSVGGLNAWCAWQQEVSER